MPGLPKRGPIPAIVLATTDEDIRNCGHCQPCCIEIDQEMDLTLGELLQMAARDDHAVFTSKTLWAGELSSVKPDRCQEGINVPRVVEALRNEAILRGYSPTDTIK
jgi:heterodisulfide reductase subunit C